MNFKLLFSFLSELKENNTKDWLDANRKQYLRIKDEYCLWLNELDARLQDIDPEYYPTPGKRAITRINNNLMFHPNKPIYKDYIGAAVDRRPNTGDFYFHLGVSECFIAGGFFRPAAAILKSIREGIDYDGEALEKIINSPSFKKTFGELDTSENLKTAPKGYAKDHRHIKLLRRKSFEAYHEFDREQVFLEGFMDKVIQVYIEMLPFRRYLNQTASV